MSTPYTLRERGRQGRARSPLIVYGAGCSWFDTIDRAATHPNGIPCCPHCKSVLFEIEQAEWWARVAKQDAKEPGYEALVVWARGRCFPNFEAARAAYATRTKED